MHIIIGMPPHIIIIGAPIAIIEFMASQRSFMRGIIEASAGIIFIIMPSFVISQDIRHIIGVMPLIIMGIIMPMPPIIGIIGIIIPFIMPFIGMPIMFMGMFIGMFMGIPFGIIGIAFMASSSMACLVSFVSARTLPKGASAAEGPRRRTASFPLP
jgi:hypothetical protein